MNSDGWRHARASCLHRGARVASIRSGEWRRLNVRTTLASNAGLACYVFRMATKAARREARAAWQVTVTRSGTAASDDAVDDLYWLQVPRDERARLTWDLSRELYSLAARNRGVFDEETGTFVAVSQDDFERRLPRAAFVLTRR